MNYAVDAVKDLGVFVRAVCGENCTYGFWGGSRLYV
uniref:Uncharacterized protein n=1 Tax=Utricularia reniformis TaxID=192314 RepID=A0A1Y0B2H7_9LAMI|nr:hypothetical protein AEK19_MT1377 [Utricularia reniformis]ART31573.1 hypothetical protein AEK19_MT1377 [Utricularia reniformis]